MKMSKYIFISISKRRRINYSHGKIKKIKSINIIYDIGTEGGSSGCPIILMNNSKIIGLHVGTLAEYKNKNKINIGISINVIINKISFIKYTYEINKIIIPFK